jgi:septal ring-binding cell division protein DamX
MKGLLSGLIALLLTFGGGYFYGKYVEREIQQAEVDRLNTEARAKEQALAAAVTTTAEALRKTNEKAKLATKQRDAAIDSGALKLRVKTTCPVHTPADTPAPAGSGGGEASAELDRETAKALVAITDEGNRAIEKLNACITLYNNARSAQ